MYLVMKMEKRISKIIVGSSGGTAGKGSETLSEDAQYGAVNAIAEADMLIIGGTSLRVYPAAGFIRYFRGKHIVVKIFFYNFVFYNSILLSLYFFY